jgi:hypothetical protein
MKPTGDDTAAMSSSGSGTDWQFVGKIGALVAYGALVGYAAWTGNPLASTLASIVFAVIAAAVGVWILRRWGTGPLPLASGGSLIGAGLAELATLVTQSTSLATLSNLLLFLGLGIYLYMGRKVGV